MKQKDHVILGTSYPGLKNTVNVLEILSSTCKCKNVDMTVLANILQLSLPILSKVPLKPFHRNPPEKLCKIYKEFIRISSHSLKERSPQGLLRAIKGKCQESKCKVKLL